MNHFKEIIIHLQNNRKQSVDERFVRMLPLSNLHPRAKVSSTHSFSSRLFSPIHLSSFEVKAPWIHPQKKTKFLNSLTSRGTNQLINRGSQRAIEGKAIINITAITSQARNGMAAQKISPIVVSEGATPFITNRLSPKGGVVVAISMFSKYITENHSGS